MQTFDFYEIRKKSKIQRNTQTSDRDLTNFFSREIGTLTEISKILSTILLNTKTAMQFSLNCDCVSYT